MKNSNDLLSNYKANCGNPDTSNQRFILDRVNDALVLAIKSTQSNLIGHSKHTELVST